MDGERRLLLDWALVVVAAIAASVVLGLLHVPSAALFGGLLAAVIRALAGRRHLRVPRVAMTAAQAIIGVSIGALVDLDTLATIGEDWLPVLLVTLGTLLLSVLGGLLLRVHRGITPVTGAFSMIAGGASGITAMARDLGADERMVGVLQYLRVLLIVVLMPLAATTVYGASAASGGAADDGGAGWPLELLVTVVCGVAGVVLGRLVRLPVAALLGPMILAAVADLTGLSHGAAAPAVVENAAFLVIGLQVGIGFTWESLRTVGKALPLALGIIVGLVAACAGMGAVLAAATGSSQLDAYLATTPGGLYAVLATATSSGGNATFVLAVQVLRVFAMVLLAPALARLLRSRRSGRHDDTAAGHAADRSEAA